MKAPLIRLTIPFILGMAMANCFIFHLSAIPLFLISCALTGILFFFIPQPKPLSHNPRFGILAAVTALAVGMTLYTHKHQTITQGIPADTTFCSGIICEQPQAKPRSTALTVQQANGVKVMLYVGKTSTSEEGSIDINGIHIGDTVFANIKHLSPTNKIDNEFAEYHKFLFNNGICATAYVPPHNLEVFHHQGTLPFLSKLHFLQDKLHSIYSTHGIDGESAGVIEAMTIGRKAELSKDTRANYANSGVSHVLALSGYHVATILIILQFLLFNRITPFRWTAITNILILLALWCYTIIAGASPSLIRATTMCTILLLCQTCTRQLISLNSIALTITLMLSYNPLHLFNIGFQLSFISVLGISLLSTRLFSLCPTHNRFIASIWQIISISLICSLFTAPLVAYHFGSIPLYSVLSNIAITILVFIIIATTILWWATLWIPSVTTILTSILTWTADTMNSIVESIASLPHSTLEWHPSVYGVSLCYILYILLYLLIKELSCEFFGNFLKNMYICKR